MPWALFLFLVLQIPKLEARASLRLMDSGVYAGGIVHVASGAATMSFQAHRAALVRMAYPKAGD